MSRRRKVILGVSAGFVFILLAALCLFPREPLHNGKTVREWFDASVNSTNASLSAEADRQLLALGPDAISYLLTRLERKDTQWGQRYEHWWSKAPPIVRARLPLPQPGYFEQVAAVAFLEKMKEKAAPAVPALLHLLDSPEDTNATSTVYFGGHGGGSQLKIQAFQALVIISPYNTNVIAAMLRQTNRSRSFLIYRLRELSGSPALAPAILKSKPLLRATFKSGDAFQRALVLDFCRVVIAKSPDLQDLVLKGMKDPVEHVQSLALRLVSQIQAPDEVMVSAVVDALAGQALRGSEAPEDPFTQDLASTLAMDVLRQLPQDETLWQALEKGLDHTNSVVRARCVMVLAELADAMPRFQPLIEQRLNDESQAVQYQAALVLWRMAEKPQSLVQFMVQRLGHSDEGQRWGAVTFLETYARGHTVVRRALEARVQMDSSFRVRARAATALGELGGDDPVMMEVLTNAAERDEYLTVRDAAGKALAKLQVDPSPQAP